MAIHMKNDAASSVMALLAMPSFCHALQDASMIGTGRSHAKRGTFCMALHPALSNPTSISGAAYSFGCARQSHAQGPPEGQSMQTGQ